MTVNEFLLKLDLPAVITHFGWEMPKYFRKIPLLGWYCMSKNEDIVFNAIDLYRWNVANAVKLDDVTFMRECYRYYTNRLDLFTDKVVYSEKTETNLANQYLHKISNEKFYKVCRAEALSGFVYYQARSVKFTKLLENELGMPELINSGIGIISKKILDYKEFKILCLNHRIGNNIILLPSFFAPDKIASLETGLLGDMTIKNMIYLDRETGWYGKLGSNIVGSIKDLMTVPGCTWSPKLLNWTNNTILSLHHSLQPDQLIDIWANKDNIVTDKDPISLIGSNKLLDHIKDNISKLTITQIKDLEKVTGQTLKDTWLSLKTSETTVGDIKFISNNDRYYYIRKGVPVEYTNFIIELENIVKEDDKFYQLGTIIMDGNSTSFKLNRHKDFASQYTFLKAITLVTLNANLKPPKVAPNLKNYIVDVVDAFNPENENKPSDTTRQGS